MNATTGKKVAALIESLLITDYCFQKNLDSQDLEACLLMKKRYNNIVKQLRAFNISIAEKAATF